MQNKSNASYPVIVYVSSQHTSRYHYSLLHILILSSSVYIYIYIYIYIIPILSTREVL
jgi:hypothetical protein